MKYTQAITFLSALAGLTSAAPAAESRQFKAVITFTGAAASYTLDVPTDGSVFYTSKSRDKSNISLLSFLIFPCPPLPPLTSPSVLMLRLY